MMSNNTNTAAVDLKTIPYGIANYETIAKGCYYVDKTCFIHNIEKKGRFLFFIRPRRFGKSLFLSVLESYYDINSKGRFEELFGDTAIGKKPTPERNSYMILKLNFSAVSPKRDAVEESFTSYISNSCLKFLKRYRSILSINYDDARNKIQEKKESSDILQTLLSICAFEDYKIYVIIDEYDNFANTILTTTGEQEYHAITHGEGFLRAFFNVLKSETSDSGSPVSRLFMTGVSPVTMDDVTSGFNIGKNISLDPDLNEMLGLTRDEVETMTDYYRQSGKFHHTTADIMAIMQEWYNGYRFSSRTSRDLFNTTQVLYFIDQYLTIEDIPDTLIDDNFRIDYNKLRHLIVLDKKGAVDTNGNFSKLKEIMKKGEIHSTVKKGFPVEELTQASNFISLLYYFGLLTITGVNEENDAILKIPNETVKQLYYDYIKSTYAETIGFTLNLEKYSTLMKGMAFKGQWQPLLDYLGAQIEANMSLRDLIQGEKAIQSFLNVYLGLSDVFIVRGEKELNKGFADLVLQGYTVKYPNIKYSFLIEIKYMKPTPADRDNKENIVKNTLEQLKKEAQDQLNRYSLDQQFKKITGKTELIKLILIFSGHRLVYMGRA